MTTHPPRRRPRWLTVVFILLVVVPIAEISVIVAVGKAIGGWQTFFLLLVESALGAWLVRREGAKTWQALRVALQTGRMPSRELTDAALVLVGGTLLLAPGFLTDIVGFFFVLPVTRPLARRLLERAVAARLLRGWGGPGGAGGAGGDTIEGEVL
ncbi:MAG: FxsA family protein [Oryzihumus sp.]